MHTRRMTGGNPLYLVSVAAIVLGVVGIVKKNSKKGMAIVGLILGGSSILFGIIMDIIMIPFTYGLSFLA